MFFQDLLKVAINLAEAFFIAAYGYYRILVKVPPVLPIIKGGIQHSNPQFQRITLQPIGHDSLIIQNYKIKEGMNGIKGIIPCSWTLIQRGFPYSINRLSCSWGPRFRSGLACVLTLPHPALPLISSHTLHFHYLCHNQG